MNTPDHPRRPFVIATPGALRDAHGLRVEPCLEVAVERLIASRQIRYRRAEGIVLVDGDGWMATVRRTRSPLDTRKAWLVTDVLPLRRRGRR
jgi:hypothetical protein